MLIVDLATITLFSNIMLVLAEVATLCYVTKWWLEENKAATDKILTAWILVSAGYLLRIGYWAVGVYVGDSGQYLKCDLDMTNCITKTSSYPVWALEHRGWLIIAAFMVVWGSLMFIQHIEGFSFKRKISLFTLIVALATLPLVMQ